MKRRQRSNYRSQSSKEHTAHMCVSVCVCGGLLETRAYFGRPLMMILCCIGG
jgi:hypothetical protein